MSWYRQTLSVAVLFSIAVSAGCSGDGPYQPVENDLRSLGMLYGSFRGDHGGKPATSDQEFKDYVSALPAETLEKYQVDDVDNLFISARDEQPYVILYGDAARTNPGQLIAYEKEGELGKRWVVDRLGVVEEMNEAAFQQMMNGGK